jgi:hypothetical protein
MELLESKSLLAKLMATENLTVEQRPVQTASFNVETRVLTLPVLDKKISGSLYDLFTGHEVGHALYTPMDGMIKARALKISRDIANVVEDSRIERKIKHKYPGLKNSFVKAYGELMERDFFGIKGNDINEMNFLDRINLHCKGGAALRIKFTDFERELLDEVETTETYDDVIDVSKKIFEYMKQQFEEQQKEREKNKAEETDSDEDDFDEDDFETADMFGDSFDIDDDGQSEKETDEVSEDTTETEDDEPDSKSGSGSQYLDKLKEELEDYIRSYTDEAYKENEKLLFDGNPTSYAYVNIPHIDPKQVFDHKALWKAYKEDDYNGLNTQEYMKFRKESNKVVSYLVKEFELRKNADQMKRATTAKTGEINMSKVFSYNFNEDIFKKMTIIPGGKSHGLVMFLDWSGSMVDHMANTMKQVFNLALFCKKVNIPFEVYSFLEETYQEKMIDVVRKKGDLVVRKYGLANILSSKMSNTEFTYAASALTYISGIGKRHCGRAPYWMSMSGTPLNEAILHAMTIVPEFQKANKLQIVNTIFLTDGEGGNLREYYDSSSYPVYVRDTKMVIRDPITRFEEVVDSNMKDQTDALIRLLKARTKSNVIGFYVCHGRDFNRKVYDWFPKQMNQEVLKANFRKDKFTVLETTGYDEYYILRSSGLDTDEEAEFEVKGNATNRGIASAFSKYNGNRMGSRVILNRFIKLIA